MNLHVCTGNTLKMLTEMNENMYVKIKNNTSKFRNNAKNLPSLYEFNNPDYNCSKLSVSNETFSIVVNVTKFGPILFVDEVGITPFHYVELTSHNKKEEIGSTELKYCEGNTYSGFLYKIGPRPLCPDIVESRNRKHVKGRIIVYKPNIISYSHPVTKCTITNTYVYSNGGFPIFKSASDNKPPISKPYNANLNMCVNSTEFKKNYPQYYNRRRNVLPVVDDLEHKLKCGPHHNVCKYWRKNHKVTNPKFFDYLKTNNGTFEKGLVSGSYVYGRKPHYQYMIARSQHDNFRRAIMINTEMHIKNGVGYTSWGKIPKDVLKKNYYYGFDDGVVIWDDIPKDDICEYIPRYTADVDSIRYDHNDINDVMKDGVYLKYFVSDQFKSVIAVTNEMEIENKKYTCIPKSYDYDYKYKNESTHIYKLNTGEILLWFPYKDSNKKKNRGDDDGEKHIKFHSALNYKLINIHKNNVVRMQHAVDVSQIDNSYKLIYHSHHIDNNNTNETGVDTDGTTDIFLNNGASKIMNHHHHHQVLDTENLQFQNYKDKTQQEMNQHIRVFQNCKQDQLMYDNTKKLLDIDPSRVLSEKLNRPVEASHGGNNYYNVKECEKVIIHKVLKSMITNDTSYKINTDRFADENFDSIDLGLNEQPVPDAYKDIPTILRERGNVVPSVGKCLSYPLVIFSLTEFPIKMIGQITKFGTILTSNFYYLEQCDIRRNHAFDIKDKVYYFERYKLQKVYNRSEINTKNDDDDNNIKIVAFERPSDTEEEEAVNYHIPTNVVAENLYSIQNYQSAFSTLSDLIYAVSEYTRAKVKYEYNPEYKGSDGDGNGIFDLKFDNNLVSSITGGLGHIIGSIGSAGKDLIEGIGLGGGQFLEHAGTGLGNAAQGIGKGGSSLISSLGSALGNTFLPFLLAIVGIIAFAIILYILYKKVFMNDDYEYKKLN